MEAKLSYKWISECRRYFRDFMSETGFEEPERNGTRGSRFEYPEWLIMFIAVLAVKCHQTSYVGIHRMTRTYWSQIAKGLNCADKPISERQLRDRLKKISYKPGKTPVFIQQIFPKGYFYD